MAEHQQGMEAIPVPAIAGQADLAGLVSRAAAGDEIAFTMIVAAHHHGMTRVAFIVTGDLDLADDAVAAAWSLAWRRLGSVREPDRLRAWLISIAANEARRLARARRRRNVVEIDIETQVELSGGADHGRRPVGDLDLVNALKRLSVEDRAFLALRYVAGFDSFELARATGRSASGTRARLSRLLARLRTELSDD